MADLILGHRGMVGSAIHRLLPEATVDVTELRIDLTWLEDTEELIAASEPETLWLCAAKVGGIRANMERPADFITLNLMIQANVIDSACATSRPLVIFLGSSCIYPKDHLCPIPEEALLTGPLEPTNEAYAIAKIAGIKMLEAYKKQYGMEYLALMPCNLYGPGDDFDTEDSHVIPAMIRKFHVAKEANAETVTLWGSGRPRREFMYVDDFARIAVDLVKKGARGLINVGMGYDIPVATAADGAADATGYEGEIYFDHTGPDGVSRKLLDITKLKRFDVPEPRSLFEGLKDTYRWYREQQ